MGQVVFSHELLGEMLIELSVPPQVLSSECEEESDTKSEEKPTEKIIGEIEPKKP